MSAAGWTEAEALDALDAFDSALAHPWLTSPPIDSLDASLIDLPYSHLLLSSPPPLSSPSPLQSEMSRTATRHARHSTLRTPLPAKRAVTLPHSASSASSSTSAKSAPAATSTPPTVKLAAPRPSHHRRVSSFSPSSLSPQAADDKQAGRTPRRRAAEVDHRIQPPIAAAPSVQVSTTPPTLRKSSSDDGRESRPADTISDGDILGKLHQLLEEALVIQQAQGQAEQGHGQQAQPEQEQMAQRAQASDRPLADITNITPRTQVANRPLTAANKRSASAAPGKDNVQLVPSTQPKKSALKRPTTTATSATSAGVPRRRSSTRRAIFTAQPANKVDASKRSSLASLPPTSIALRTTTSAAELSAVVRGFLQRVLSLLRAIEQLLSRRLAALRAEAARLLRDSWCGSTGLSSCLERLASSSSSLLHSMHAAIHTPIITLHYPEALAAFIPSFLSSPSSSISVSPSQLASPWPVLSPPTTTSVNPATPPPLLPALQADIVVVPVSPLLTSYLPQAPVVAFSDPSAPTTPSSSEAAECGTSSQLQAAIGCSSWDSERAVLVSTIGQLQSFLAVQQAASLTLEPSSLSALSSENRDLRTLIEAQEQQIARQQDMIAQARRQIERQCRGELSSSGSSSGGGVMAGMSLELSALSEAADGSHEAASSAHGSGSRSGCGDVSAMMRAEWESGVQEVLSW